MTGAPWVREDGGDQATASWRNPGGELSNIVRIFVVTAVPVVFLLLPPWQPQIHVRPSPFCTTDIKLRLPPLFLLRFDPMKSR